MLKAVLALLSVGIVGATVFYIVRINRRLARYASARRHSEQHERSRNHVLELLAHGAPLPTILEAIVRGVEQENPAMLCSISLLDSAGQHLLTRSEERRVGKE